MDDTHIAHELTAGKHAVKHVEMTVRRALAFIEVFDEWTEKFNSSGYQGVQDWRDIVSSDPAAFRRIYGDDHYEIQPRMEIEELWNRYKSGTLQQEVLALAENVPMDKISKKARKEIERGISRISN